MKAAFTIITTNYISYAKTLADSLLKYNPDYQFYICLIGKTGDLKILLDNSRFTILETNVLEDKVLVDQMQLQYNPFELSCALKPFFAEYILKNNAKINRLKYLDSDIMFFNSFDNVIEKDTTSTIFLTPHFFNPVDLTEGNSNDALLLKLGVYNAGYFEVTNTPMAYSFLKWWKSRLALYCYDCKQPHAEIFVDQSWLNLVPVYFKNTCIIDNVGYNTSFYNLKERKLSKNADEFFVNEKQPLIFFHYTGYRYYQHERASVHHPYYTYNNTPYLEEVCINYRDLLINNQIEITSPGPVTTATINNKISYKGLALKIINKAMSKILKLRIVKVD